MFIFQKQIKILLMKSSIPPFKVHFTNTLMLQKVYKDIVKAIHLNPVV